LPPGSRTQSEAGNTAALAVPAVVGERLSIAGTGR
jgi:hypothetical protein